MTIRLVLAEDNYLVREGLVALLTQVPEVELVGAVEDADALLAAVEAHAPDVVMTDIRMPPSHTTEGIVAAKRIRADHPGTGVLVLSQHVEDEYAYELLKDGVSGLGYLLKERVGEVDELVRALTELARGGSVLDPQVVERLMARNARSATSAVARLTEREHDVLQQMAEGKNNAAIAGSLYLSERAVEKHINAMFAKLGLTPEDAVNRRVMAVLTYLREGGAAVRG